MIPPKQYDAIVIGSGIPEAALAAIIVRQGLNVLAIGDDGTQTRVFATEFDENGVTVLTNAGEAFRARFLVDFASTSQQNFQPRPCRQIDHLHTA